MKLEDTIDYNTNLDYYQAKQYYKKRLGRKWRKKREFLMEKYLKWCSPKCCFCNQKIFFNNKGKKKQAFKDLKFYF